MLFGYLQENLELMMVKSKINELMTDRGFPLKNLESSLKTLSWLSPCLSEFAYHASIFNNSLWSPLPYVAPAPGIVKIHFAAFHIPDNRAQQDVRGGRALRESAPCARRFAASVTARQCDIILRFCKSDACFSSTAF